MLGQQMELRERLILRRLVHGSSLFRCPGKSPTTEWMTLSAVPLECHQSGDRAGSVSGAPAQTAAVRRNWGCRSNEIKPVRSSEITFGGTTKLILSGRKICLFRYTYNLSAQRNIIFRSNNRVFRSNKT